MSFPENLTLMLFQFCPPSQPYPRKLPPDEPHIQGPCIEIPLGMSFTENQTVMFFLTCGQTSKQTNYVCMTLLHEKENICVESMFTRHIKRKCELELKSEQ